MRHTLLRVVLALALVAGVTVASQPTARADAPGPLSAAIKVPAYPGQTKPLPGQLVTITGDIGTDGVRAVTLQNYTTKWATFASGATAADGNFSFDASTTAATRRFRVTAAKTTSLPAVTTGEVIVTTLADSVSLSVFRAGNTLQITGQASIPLTGRSFALQYKSGSSWIAVTTDPSALAEDATGAIKAKTAVDGSKTYRLLGAAVGNLPTVASNSVAFSASPATLGKNVIYVTTDSGVTPTTKGKDYTGSATLVSGDTVAGPYRLETIAVRGNSSATKPKKPYKLKFVDQQKPFAMKSDRTWILLANYVDRTLVRSKVAFDLGKKQNGLAWTADSKFTELYINGKYIGSYQLTQSIKIAGSRVPADKKFGQVIENDPHYASDGVPGFKGLSGQPFSFKDPDEWKTVAEGPTAVNDAVKGWLDPEGLTTEKVTQVTKKINVFEAILYGKDKKKDWSTIDPTGLADCNWGDFTLATTSLSTAEWAKAATCDWEDFLDMPSAVDYILVREFTKDNDADFYRSNFFWVKDYRSSTDKLRMGPVWDFDRSAGAHDPSSTNIQLPTGWWTNGGGSSNHNTNKIHWFTRIWKDSRFVGALKARWGDQRADYLAVSDGYNSDGDNSGLNLAVAQLDDPAASAGATDSQVAANDRAKWGSSGSRYKAKSSTFKGEVAWLKKWYADRFNWMDGAIDKF